MKKEKFYTAEEAGEKTGLHPNTIRRWAVEGRLSIAGTQSDGRGRPRNLYRLEEVKEEARKVGAGTQLPSKRFWVRIPEEDAKRLTGTAAEVCRATSRGVSVPDVIQRIVSGITDKELRSIMDEMIEDLG